MENDSSLTIKEVAKFLNISNQMVYNLIKAQEIPAFKVGSAVRVLRSDLTAWIGSRKSLYAAQNRDEENEDDSLFDVRNLFVKAGPFLVENVSFSFPRGKIMTLLGASGSGKTLLLKGIAGILTPEAGSVFLGTQRLDAVDPKTRHIGFVYQDYALYPNMRPKENIGFPLQNMNMDRKTIDQEVMNVVQELKIDDSFLRKYPNQLPEGVKQLIAIGREKIHAIELYLMDEPMSHLDAHVRAEMRSFIKQIVMKLGKTTIIAVNSPDDALSLSDYTGILERGRLVQFGPTFDVFDRPASLTVMNAMSANGVNVLEVAVEGGRADPYGIPADVPDGDYLLAFRPEEVELSEEGIEVEVKKTVFYDGKRLLADCRTAEGREVKLIIPAGSGEKLTAVPGKPVFFPA